MELRTALPEYNFRKGNLYGHPANNKEKDYTHE